MKCTIFGQSSEARVPVTPAYWRGKSGNGTIKGSQLCEGIYGSAMCTPLRMELAALAVFVSLCTFAPPTRPARLPSNWRMAQKVLANAVKFANGPSEWEFYLLQRQLLVKHIEMKCFLELFPKAPNRLEQSVSDLTFLEACSEILKMVTTVILCVFSSCGKHESSPTKLP